MCEWSSSLCLWSHLSNVRDQSRRNRSPIKTSQTRTDHPTDGTGCWSYDHEFCGQCQKCTGWASHKQHTLLAGQFSSFAQDQGKGEYKQFVANHVKKINSHKGVTWHFVPTVDKPANLGSRGGCLDGSRF